MTMRVEGLSDAARSEVMALADRAAAADGVFPLNEQAVISLAEAGRHRLAWREGRLVGYLCVYDGAAQLVVDPLWRRQRVGSRLLVDHDICIWDQKEPDPVVPEVWAFGDLGCGQGFCAAHGYRAVRSLLVMESSVRPARRGDPPAGVRIGAYHSGDLAELVGLNARAFHDHPEQGRWVAADFAARMAQPWFDPAGLLIARTDEGLMVGFHWTKAEHGDGEVYVIGVDPGWSGRGLGRALLDAGLAHLAARRVGRTRLWVDGENLAATSLYEKSGFSVVRRDVRYRRRSDVRDHQS